MSTPSECCLRWNSQQGVQQRRLIHATKWQRREATKEYCPTWAPISNMTMSDCGTCARRDLVSVRRIRLAKMNGRARRTRSVSITNPSTSIRVESTNAKLAVPFAQKAASVDFFFDSHEISVPSEWLGKGTGRLKNVLRFLSGEHR